MRLQVFVQRSNRKFCCSVNDKNRGPEDVLPFAPRLRFWCRVASYATFDWPIAVFSDASTLVRSTNVSV